jgi:hypothetical protein
VVVVVVVVVAGGVVGTQAAPTVATIATAGTAIRARCRARARERTGLMLVSSRAGTAPTSFLE